VAEEPVVTETPAETPSETPSLEEVYKEYNVDRVADDFSTRTAPPEQRTETPVRPTAVPDPVTDVDGFKNFLSSDIQDRNVIKETLRRVSSQLDQDRMARARSQEEADVKKAVDAINADLKADPDLVEFALAKEARQDSRFLKLWENRAKQPQAWEKALKAVGKKLEGKFQFRADPQLVENQRAVKTAQSALATASKASTDDERLGAMDLSEMNKYLDQIKQRF
jgi:hypothetical protein